MAGSKYESPFTKQSDGKFRFDPASPLVHAAVGDFDEVVRPSFQLLHVACRAGYLDVVEKILRDTIIDFKAHCFPSIALLAAAYCSHNDVVDLLINQRADPALLKHTSGHHEGAYFIAHANKNKINLL